MTAYYLVYGTPSASVVAQSLVAAGRLAQGDVHVPQAVARSASSVNESLGGAGIDFSAQVRFRSSGQTKGRAPRDGYSGGLSGVGSLPDLQHEGTAAGR